MGKCKLRAAVRSFRSEQQASMIGVVVIHPDGRRVRITDSYGNQFSFRQVFLDGSLGHVEQGLAFKI